jgi:PAS domain S-box-containing protein
MKLKTMLLTGFLMIMLLTIIEAGANYYMNIQVQEMTSQINEVEYPLALMVQQVIGYDGILSESAHISLLLAEQGNMEEIQAHKAYYDEVSAQLDDTLNINALALLEKSGRSEEAKNATEIYLEKINDLNLELVDLETRAFDAIESNDTSKAHSLIVGEEYMRAKKELYLTYLEWADLERKTLLVMTGERDRNLQLLDHLNLYFSAAIIALALLISFFMSHLITSTIQNLKDEVDDITKGNLDIQLKTSGIAEIQSLTDSLNRILATMKLAILRTGLTKRELGLGEVLKAKEEVEKKYDALFTSSKDSVMTLEAPSWRFTSGNPATLKLFGVKDEQEFISFGPWDLSPERQPDGQLSSVKMKEMIDTAVKKGSAFFKWTHKRRDGSTFLSTVLLNRTVGQGEHMSLFANVRDLSSQNTCALESPKKEIIDPQEAEAEQTVRKGSPKPARRNKITSKNR